MTKPWITDILPQKDSTEDGVKDLYKSGSVVINGVPVVLYETPGAAGTGSSEPSAAESDSTVALQSAAEPTLTTLSPTQENNIASSAGAADSDEEKSVGLGGVGEVSEEGTPENTTPAGSDVTGAVAGSNEYAKLCTLINNCLAEASSGKWKENGSNAKIINCYKTVGFNLSNDKTPWCAGFAGAMLKLAGIPSLKTLSSLAYRPHGAAVDVNDKSKWRLNDIVIFTRKGGGHIGFYRGITSSGKIAIAGGNQSDNLTQNGFPMSGKNLKVTAVRRAWTLTAEQDIPISGTAPGAGASGKVT